MTAKTQNIQATLAFLQQCAQTIQQQADTEITRQGAQRFQVSLNKTRVKPFNPQPLPVLNSIGQIAGTPLTRGFHDIAASLSWKPSPRSDDGGTLMALSVLNDMFELGDVMAGLLYLDSHQCYPEHRHPPQELYLILAGDADWRYGGSSEYVPRPPGSVLYNHPQDLHGIKANQSPLLALYVLWPS